MKYEDIKTEHRDGSKGRRRGRKIFRGILRYREERESRTNRVSTFAKGSSFFYVRSIDAENDALYSLLRQQESPPSTKARRFRARTAIDSREGCSSRGKFPQEKFLQENPSRELAIVPILFLSIRVVFSCARYRTTSVGRNIFFLIIFLFLELQEFGILYNSREERFHPKGMVNFIINNCFISGEKKKTLKSFMHFVRKEI